MHCYRTDIIMETDGSLSAASIIFNNTYIISSKSSPTLANTAQAATITRNSSQLIVGSPKAARETHELKFI